MRGFKCTKDTTSTGWPRSVLHPFDLPILETLYVFVCLLEFNGTLESINVPFWCCSVFNMDKNLQVSSKSLLIEIIYVSCKFYCQWSITCQWSICDKITICDKIKLYFIDDSGLPQKTHDLITGHVWSCRPSRLSILWVFTQNMLYGEMALTLSAFWVCRGNKTCLRHLQQIVTYQICNYSQNEIKAICSWSQI